MICTTGIAVLGKPPACCVAVRDAADQACFCVNAHFAARRFPGVNLRPMTGCVTDSASALAMVAMAGGGALACAEQGSLAAGLSG